MRPLALLLLVGACSSPGELSGYIGPKMLAKVEAGIASGEREFSINRTDGGEVFAALVIAGKLNEADATLTINGRCASACVILAKAVEHRIVTQEAEFWEHEAYVRYKPGPASNLRKVSLP